MQGTGSIASSTLIELFNARLATASGSTVALEGIESVTAAGEWSSGFGVGNDAMNF